MGSLSVATAGDARVNYMEVLTKLILALGMFVGIIAMLAAGVAGGGFLGFALGYLIMGDSAHNPHQGMIVVLLWMIGGAILGFVVSAIAIYRLSVRKTD